MRCPGPELLVLRVKTCGCSLQILPNVTNNWTLSILYFLKHWSVHVPCMAPF